MNAWDLRWLEMAEDNQIRIITGVRYMDDIRIFTRAIREGWRWWEGTLCYTEQWRIEDQKDGISSTAKTVRVLVAIMDVYEFLGFTPEIGEDFTDLKLPMRSQWWPTSSSMPKLLSVTKQNCPL